MEQDAPIPKVAPSNLSSRCRVRSSRVSHGTSSSAHSISQDMDPMSILFYGSMLRVVRAPFLIQLLLMFRYLVYLYIYFLYI